MQVLVAAGALIKCEWLLEITAGVALHAADRLMFSEQRIFGFRMVKVLADGFQRNAPPAAGVVAGLAALLAKTSVVWIGMAVVALTEGQANIAGLIVGSGGVAFLASHLGV